MITIRVPVPGFPDESTNYVDVETRKVPYGKPLSSGYVLSKRWSVFAIGIACKGWINILADNDEENLLKVAADVIDPFRPMTYAATRNFDEMILKGRFTNARRAHEQEAFYPTLPGAEQLVWRNIHSKSRLLFDSASMMRSFDIDSKHVPDLWQESFSDSKRFMYEEREQAVSIAFSNRERLMVHLLRDVCELMLVYDRSDPQANRWFMDVLRHYTDASSAIRKGLSSAAI